MAERVEGSSQSVHVNLEAQIRRDYFIEASVRPVIYTEPFESDIHVHSSQIDHLPPLFSLIGLYWIIDIISISFNLNMLHLCTNIQRSNSTS
jgi:hypothetical protein